MTTHSGSAPTADEFTCHRLKLRADAHGAVEAWAREMDARAEEVSATLRAEGVELELVLYETAADGDYLLFLLKTKDYARACDVFARSTLPIDEVHRRFLADHIVDRRPVRVLSCHVP